MWWIVGGIAVALLLAGRPAGIRWVRATAAEDYRDAPSPTTNAVQPPERLSNDAAAAGPVVAQAVPQPDEGVLAVIMAEMRRPRWQHLEHIERVAGPDVAERLAPYRQAIEDVMPLLASTESQKAVL